MPASNRALFKIGVGLAVVTIAASVGWSADRGATPAPHAMPSGTGELASAAGGRAAEHRKQIFDERRAHYFESRSAQQAQASAHAHARAAP
jgi:hypothetical protein